MSGWSWPSKDKLVSLRKKGEIPYSSFSTRVILLAVLMLVASFSAKQLYLFKEACREYLAQPNFDLFYGSNPFWDRSFNLLLLVPLIALGSILFVGLLQNKFFFNLGLLKFDLGGFSKERTWNFSGKLVVALILVAFLALIIFQIVLNSYYIATFLHGLLDIPIDYILNSSLRGFFLLAAIGLVAMSVVWWIAQWVYFLWQHRTKET